MNYIIKNTKLNPNRVFILQKSEMEKRLDPFYYVPGLVELERKVLAKQPKRLRDYVKNIASGATPKTAEVEKYYSDEENGKPFLRVQNLSPTGILEFDDCKYINEETHNGMLKRSQVSAGDLLVKITGVGRMAVASVAPENFEGNINQHVCVIKTDSKEVSKTLAAYLNSDIGEKLASRRSTGGTRPALDYPALLSIPIIEDKRILEITKKVIEQKKQNEAEAEKFLSSIDDYLLGELGINLPEPPENTLKNRMFIVSLKDISGGRFDPKLYDNNTQAIRNAIKGTNFEKPKLKELVTHSVAGDWGKDEKENLADNYKRCLVIRATEFDNLYNLNLDNSRVKYRLINTDKLDRMDIQENDLLIEKSGGSPDQPVGRISILTNEILKTHQIGYSNFIHKIRVDNSKINSEYLFCFLKTVHNIKLTDAMQSQTNGIRNLIMSNYFNQIIPLPPLDKQEEIAEHISGIREKAQMLKDKTAELLKEASKEIENILLN